MNCIPAWIIQHHVIGPYKGPIFVVVFELQEILRRLEDEGTRTLFTDSKSQYHHSIKKASWLNSQFHVIKDVTFLV